MRVFVYQGYYPAGGTYMAYHLGRILHEHFGCEVYCVGDRPADSMFSYPVELPSMDEQAFLQECTAEDLLICNPSFSALQFGLRLPCRKLSYIQGVRTFAVLDVCFDHYVFVSEWARRFVSDYYGIDGNIIPAFVADRFLLPAPAWRSRKATFITSQRKFEDVHFQKLRTVYAARYPGEMFPCEVVPVLPQAELAERFRGVRHYLSLDAMEGFGLPMLEAMACGCAVAGWDSGGNREYAVHGKNALLARYGDFAGLADHIHALLNDEAAAERMGVAGAETAKHFDAGRFDASWVAEFSRFLGRAAP
jgi:hypothetical protein